MSKHYSKLLSVLVVIAVIIVSFIAYSNKPDNAFAQSVSLVQSRAGTNCFGGITCDTTYTSANMAGNTSVVLIQWIMASGSATVSSVTDTQGNVYTIIPATLENVGPTTHYSNIYTQIAYATNIKAGTNTVTVTWNTAVGLGSNFASLYELSPSALDLTSIGTGTSASPSAGSVTTTINGEFALAVAIVDDGIGSPGSFTAGSGWTISQNTGGGSGAFATEYQAQASAGSITGDFTSNSGQWVASMAVFKTTVSNSNNPHTQIRGGGTPASANPFIKLRGGSGGGGGGSVTMVQIKQGGSNFGATSANVTFDSTVGSGNGVVACVQWTANIGTGHTPISSLSDDKSNSYTALTAQSRTATNYDYVDVQCFYTLNVTNGPITITANWSQSVAASIYLAEFTAGIYDQSTGTTGNSTNPSAGALTPSGSGEFGMAIYLVDNGLGSNNTTAGSGWTLIGSPDGGGSQENAAEYQNISGAGSVTGNFGQPNGGPWAATMVLFKSNGGASGGSVKFR